MKAHTQTSFSCGMDWVQIDIDSMLFLVFSSFSFLVLRIKQEIDLNWGGAC